MSLAIPRMRPVPHQNPQKPRPPGHISPEHHPPTEKWQLPSWGDSRKMSVRAASLGALAPERWLTNENVAVHVGFTLDLNGI